MTPITFHQASVLYSGSAFVIASLFIFGVFQLVGPRYPDHWPLGPIRRAIIFFLGVMALIRGVTLFFPGEAVPIQHVSSLMPWWATAVLLASGMTAELVSGHRLPPPLMQRLGLWLRQTKNTPAIEAAMFASPPADLLGDSLYDAPPAATVRLGGARLRTAVLLACGIGLVILLLVVWHAAAATLPT